MKALLALAATAVLFAQTGSGPSFAEAEVDPVAANASPVLIGAIRGSNRYELHGATMLNLIALAWDVPETRVAGGPTWLATNRFDIVARAPAGANAGGERAMLQRLLVERFSLAIHTDIRSVSGFSIKVAAGAPKMKQSDGSSESTCTQQSVPGQGQSYSSWQCQNMTMAAFASRLPQIAPAYFRGGAGLVDRTSLAGGWDFTFQYSPLVMAKQPGGIPLFEGLEKQLGLHIEAGQVEAPVIVVDGVNERPTDNAPGVKSKPSGPLEFEIASLKPTPAENTKTNLSLRGGRVDIQNLTLKALILLAWNATDDKIVGLPPFTLSDRYDIAAKADADTALESLRGMLRSLLTDRFHIAVHNDTRTVEVLALRAAARPKLTKADPAGRADCQEGPITNPANPRSIVCRNTTMEQLAAAIGRLAQGYTAGRTVVDATGISGAYDLTLNFSPAAFLEATAESATASDPTAAVSLPQALERQVGLNLKSEKRPMPVLVVDHVDRKPAGN